MYRLLLPLFALSTHLFAHGQGATYTERPVTITNDGWQLKGDLLLVNAKDKTPLVLFLNKANGNRKAYDEIAKILARNNISSLRLDLRGHGESTNKGKFIPFDSTNNATLHMDMGYTDIIAALKFLGSLKNIDSTRLGMLGASYSGEEMMKASREFSYIRSYVALSPGSFSNESIEKLNSLSNTMLFVKSVDERSMQGFEKDVFAKSGNARFIIVPGKVHASDILGTYPELSTMIVSWFKSQL